MKTNNVSKVREFNGLAKIAADQVKSYECNPFRRCNELNKAMQKNEFADHELIKKVAKLVQPIHGGRYAFSLDVFNKTPDGQFYFKTSEVVKTLTDKDGKILGPNPLYLQLLPALMNGEYITDGKGNPAILADGMNIDGTPRIIICHLINTKTTRGLFGNFCYIVREELKAEQRAERDAKRAAKEAKKAKAYTYDGIIKDYNAGRIDSEEMIKRIDALKETAKAA